MHVSAVLAIQIQGRHHVDQWVLTFHLEYSLDCITFYSIVDVDGNKTVRILYLYVPSNLTCLRCLQHSFFEHLFNLYLVLQFIHFNHYRRYLFVCVGGSLIRESSLIVFFLRRFSQVTNTNNVRFTMNFIVCVMNCL